jgi:hypothetical protein
MARHTVEDERMISYKLGWGVLLIVFSILGFVAIRQSLAGDMIFQHPEAAGGIWWALLALNCGFLALGLRWTLRGLQVRLPPTTFLYRITDPQRWREWFSRQG